MTEAVLDGGANAPADAVVIESTPATAGEPLPPQAEARPKEQVEIASDKVTNRDAVRIAREKLAEREAEQAKAQETKDGKVEAKAEVKPGEKEPEAKVEPKEQKAERERSPDGKFAGKEPKEPVQQDQRKPEVSHDFKNPPARFDDVAKQRWADTPDEVKASVTRMQRELESGIQKYKADAEEYEGVRYYGDWAKQGGTTLKAALDAYTGMENALRSPQTRAQGLAMLAQNLGMDPMSLAQELAQLSTGQNYQQQQPQTEQIDPRRLVYELKQEIKQEFEQQNVVSKIEQFKRDNPRFDDLSDDIAMFLSSGKIPDHLPPEERLQEAYDLAERLNPAFESETLTPSRDTRQLLAHTQSDDSRPLKPAGSKSISGAPSSGSNPDTPRQASSTLEAVRLARKRLGG